MAVAQVVDITNILQHAQSADANVRNQAEQQLKQFQAQNYASYLLSLSTELANNEKPAEARQIAGLILKNTLDATDDVRKAELVAQWSSLDTGLRQQIKQGLLGTLATEVQAARHTAALVIAKVAAIELPTKQWPDLIDKLLANMAIQPPNNGLKTATLEALGYICEEMGSLKQDVLEQEQVNSILTGVVQGMRKDEPDQSVRLAATVALFNALEFAHTNFENDNERNYLMQVVCEGTMSPETKVREASFECLVKIAGNYYDKLPAYISDIFSLTHRAVKEDEEDVAKQAIEFWSTICEEEIDLLEEEGNEDVVNHHFITKALQPLVQLMLEQLTKQEEGQDRDDSIWNVCMAASTCLGLIANVVGDAVIQLVMPFVQANIDKNQNPEDWRVRDAATSAFGYILEGPSVQQLAQLVNMGLAFLLNAMRDPSAQVRHSTAWTIGRIFEFVHGPDMVTPIITQQNLPQIVQVLLASIKDEPHIAEKVCYAFSRLAAGFRESDGTSLLSPYFKDIVQALLDAAERGSADHHSAHLQMQAFEALNDVVRYATADTLPLVVQLIPLMLAKLSHTLQMHVTTPEAQERQSELQGLLCGVLQVIIQRLGTSDSTKAGLMQYADQIMEVLLAVLACRNATVLEEAMLAVGAVTYAAQAQFVKYMERFYPVLEMGLTNHKEWHVCQLTVGVLGDVSRALEAQIAPFCDRIMSILLSNLQSNDVHREIKPQILSSFGDIALAIGAKFEPYLPHVLQMLQSAQQLSLMQQQAGDEEFFEYNNMLRNGILEAYAGIVNGMPPQKSGDYILRVLPDILNFEEFVYSDQVNVDESVLKAAIALLGDLAGTLPASAPIIRAKPFVEQLISDARSSGEPDLAQTAAWATNTISKALEGGGQSG